MRVCESILLESVINLKIPYYRSQMSQNAVGQDKKLFLLTRDQFREAVFSRDGYRCVICNEPAQDAHHIIERRLFPDGGYYLENGASLCGKDHIRAEETTLSCDDIRRAAGITRVVLPPHLYDDQSYDKWGNPIMENGTRLRGDLFYDESVQKILTPVLGIFTNRVKYPRTYHLPYSPGIGKDDRIQYDLSGFEGKEIIITEKMDGENTTLYCDYLHARSLDYTTHPSRHWAKTIWSRIAYDISQNWRVCCENLYATHSIPYDNLPGYLLMFSVWDDKNICLSWDETVEWSKLLELPMVPELYRGKWNSKVIVNIAEETVEKNGGEGIVVRVADKIPYSQFRYKVVKYVREGHVQTHDHWMRQRVTRNQLSEES
jgi:hypothetical protein